MFTRGGNFLCLTRAGPPVQVRTYLADSETPFGLWTAAHKAKRAGALAISRSPHLCPTRVVREIIAKVYHIWADSEGTLSPPAVNRSTRVPGPVLVSTSSASGFHFLTDLIAAAAAAGAAAGCHSGGRRALRVVAAGLLVLRLGAPCVGRQFTLGVPCMSAGAMTLLDAGAEPRDPHSPV